MKIEKKAVVPRSRPRTDYFTQFVRTLGKLRQGESFVVAEMNSYMRQAISTVSILLDARFAVGKEKSAYRIGRVS